MGISGRGCDHSNRAAGPAAWRDSRNQSTAIRTLLPGDSSERQGDVKSGLY